MITSGQGVFDAFGYIISAVITGCFGLFLAWQNRRLHKEVKTNHGKTIGQHVEQAGWDARDARVAAQLVALQLQEYKAQQSEEHQADQRMIDTYVSNDAIAHAEIRSLIVQVASNQMNPPTQLTQEQGGN